MPETRTIALALALVGTTLAGLAPATAQVRVMNAQGDNASSNTLPRPRPPRDWSEEDLPVSIFTMQTNLQLFEVRQDIAATATWLGPGPNDINTILAGKNDGWLDELRSEARALAGRLYDLAPAPCGMPDPGGDPGPGIDFASWTRDAGSPGVAGDDLNYDNRGHFVINLWPVVQVGNEFFAEIPYTFSDFMIASFITGGGDDAEAVNAFRGVANAFVVMLILEQELPVRFVGFNPNIHNPAAILIFESVGTGESGAGNAVSRIGRGSGIGAEPTTMTHNSWQNFPSLVRSLGFVMGLDWEQRNPVRDQYIDVDFTAIPPFGFPTPIGPANGLLGPGIPFTISPLGFADSGPIFYDTTATVTTVVGEGPCAFDLDSIMLLRPFDLISIEPAYVIRDPYRYVDFNGDNVVDTTPGGPDDRMFNQPNPIFFSECDRVTIGTLYATDDGPGSGWFFGQDEFCPHDVNQDGIQDSRDIRAFLELFQVQSASTDLAPPFGQWTQEDLLAFTTTFVPGICSPTGPPDPFNRPNNFWPD
jgi:hypothetical protein